MRTKIALLAAAALAAGALSSMAQSNVYSLNVVGYINVSCPPGFFIIGNQLNNTNATVNTVLAGTTPGVTLYKYAGGTYSQNNLDPDFGWDDPTQSFAPGEAGFLRNPYSTNITVTFVGQVPQGTNLVTAVPHGFSLVGSQVPQSGLIQTALGYVPTGGDQVFRFHRDQPAYSTFTFDPDFGWDVEPSLAVGEGVFLLRTAAGTTNWTRSFTVQ